MRDGALVAASKARSRLCNDPVPAGHAGRTNPCRAVAVFDTSRPRHAGHAGRARADPCGRHAAPESVSEPPGPPSRWWRAQPCDSCQRHVGSRNASRPSRAQPCSGPDRAVASALAGRIASACGDEGTDRRGRGAGRRPHRVRAPRGTERALQGLAPGGRPAHALQQPRSRGGRGSHPPGRLRRLRPRRPQPRRPARDRAHAARARERRDDARPERQAGGRLHAPTRARRAC